MIYFLPLLSILFIPILCLKPKLCINCKFFIKDLTNDKFGKCVLFPKEENNFFMLVNGNKEDKEYQYCKVAREIESMCGKEGKKYVKKYKKRQNK